MNFWTLLFWSGIVAAASTFERSIGDQLAADLHQRLQESQPKLARSVQKITVSVKRHRNPGNGLLSEINVRIISTQSSPEFNYELKKTIEKSLREKTLNSDVRITRLPEITFDIQHRWSLEMVGLELRHNLRLVSILMLLGFLIFLLGRKARVIRQALNHLEPHIRRPIHNVVEELEEIDASPSEGTIHLDALPRLRKAELQKAFENFNVHESVAIWRGLKHAERQRLANKLELRESLRQRLDTTLPHSKIKDSRHSEGYRHTVEKTEQKLSSIWPSASSRY